MCFVLLFRAPTPKQEILKNSANCGKVETHKSRRALRQIKKENCLSRCTWKENPFFKSQPEGDAVHYGVKWYEPYYNNENTYPQLYDAPMVPENLKCLKNCFKRYLKNVELLEHVQKNCSKIGLDRQVPTHTMEGYDLVQSSFSEMPISWFTSPSAPLPMNPALDCLMYYETKERKSCRSDGICNFIQAQTDFVSASQRNPENHRLNQAIKTTITDEDDYKAYILRASNPAIRAIEVCALAKNIQFHQVNQINSSLSTVQASKLFESPSTCDKFMPDIFGSICSCVGICARLDFDPKSDPSDPNLILYFETDKGLWGCQDACKQTEYCEFYTHSKASNFEDQNKYAEIPGHPVSYCFLWKRCDNFSISDTAVIPVNSDPFFLDYPNKAWLDVRSGPKDCARYDQVCPIVKDKLNTTMPLPDGYKEVSSCDENEVNRCGFEVGN